MRVRYAIFLLLFCTNAFGAEPAQEKPPYSPFFIVGPYALYVPEGYFVLIRNGPDIGAFRIVNIMFDSSGRLGTSQYESYFLPNGSSASLQAHAVKRVGEVNIQEL